MFGGISQIVGNFDQFDAAVLQMQSPGFIDACVRASKTDSRLRGYLLSFVHVSAYSDICMYGAMMIVPIVLHHFPNLLSFMRSGDDNADTSG